MTTPQNIVGPRIKAIRLQRGLTQAMLAARCGMLGWDVGENVVTKIETQIRCVVDFELLCVAQALDVGVQDLLPPSNKSRGILLKQFADK